MSERKRAATYLSIMALSLFFLLLAMAQGGCQVCAGLGRDITAWADGGAMDAGDNARKLRNK